MIICFWFSNESISKFFGGLKSLNDMVAKYRSYVYRNRKQFISNLWGLQPLIINYDNVCDYWHYSLVNILWSMAKKWIILWFRLNCECWIRYCVIGIRLEKQARTANQSSGKASKILGRAKIFPKNSKKIANISKYPKKRSGITGSLKKMIPKNPEKIVKIPRNPEKSAQKTKNPKKKSKTSLKIGIKKEKNPKNQPKIHKNSKNIALISTNPKKKVKIIRHLKKSVSR